MSADFIKCLKKVDERFSTFVCETKLQKARSEIQNQVYEKVLTDAEIYLMNMPTGSGKTLCSMKFALQRALKSGKKRIIYIIPYNSIIEQTADNFAKIFGSCAQILRHQSTFSIDEADVDEDYKKLYKLAGENWDAQIIITTAVQFFESVYSNKRGKLRKLHNMADSILVFDEAHLMPVSYLQPCLRSVSYITRYLNSEAVFLTATMPDFNRLIKQYSFDDSIIKDLIDDTSLFAIFQKCNYIYTGKIGMDELSKEAQNSPAALIIVNKKRTARQLYSLCAGDKYHLSTYMTAYDRAMVIDDIKQKLNKLQNDYPKYKNVPESRKITVISTSLIEAGVDLDFASVFRELSGLDSILQAGGRCNREGKMDNAEVCIFELDTESSKVSGDERANITKGLIASYDDISSAECIKEYYDRLFFMRRDEITKNSISRECTNIASIPFKSYSEKFEIIDSKTVSVIAIRDETSAKLVEALKFGFANTRKLQKYAFTVYSYELEELIKQGVVSDFGSGIFCLTNKDYYDKNTGVRFEATDYIID